MACMNRDSIPSSFVMRMCFFIGRLAPDLQAERVAGETSMKRTLGKNQEQVTELAYFFSCGLFISWCMRAMVWDSPHQPYLNAAKSCPFMAEA
jgi:hypothetical protein